jgi:hypothetical protein
VQSFRAGQADATLCDEYALFLRFFVVRVFAVTIVDTLNVQAQGQERFPGESRSCAVRGPQQSFGDADAAKAL